MSADSVQPSSPLPQDLSSPPAAGSTAPPLESPPGFWRWIYNHNPFYVISTLFMLYAVRAAYGVMSIGEINSWSLLAVMGAYTLLLAGIGILIVRWGRVWEDARSIVLLLLLLFLAVSVSADDLLTQEHSAPVGSRIMLAGYLFSAVVTEAVLLGTRLRLPWVYRVPLHLFLLLFYSAPYLASPEIHGWLSDELNRIVFLFPNVAALLFLTLIPAVRRGPRAVDQNGTPWRWPLYPWCAFGMIAFAVAFRSYVFALTFCQTGPIWIELPTSSRLGDRSIHAIALDTIWGPYFLVPLLWSILLLMFEASLVTGNKRLTRRTLWWAPLLAILSIIPTGGRVYREFFQLVTDTAGSPLWLSLWFVAAFYAYATLRRVRGGWNGLIATLGLFTVVGPKTTGLHSLTTPGSIGVAILAFVLAVEAWRRRSTFVAFLACAAGSLLLVRLMPDSVSPALRQAAGFHAIWLAAVILGLVGRDSFAGFLRIVGAGLFPFAAFVAVSAVRADLVPATVRLMYTGALALASWEIARRWQLGSYLWACGGVLLSLLYFLLASLYWRLAEIYGGRSASAILWSFGALVAGSLISTHKAGRIRREEPVASEPPAE